MLLNVTVKLAVDPSLIFSWSLILIVGNLGFTSTVIVNELPTQAKGKVGINYLL